LTLFNINPNETNVKHYLKIVLIIAKNRSLLYFKHLWQIDH